VPKRWYSQAADLAGQLGAADLLLAKLEDVADAVRDCIA